MSPDPDTVALAEQLAAAERDPIVDAPRPKPKGVGRKARTQAETNDLEQWERVKALADKERRRRGHDTRVRVRFVDPATLRPADDTAADPVAERQAKRAAGLRGDNVDGGGDRKNAMRTARRRAALAAAADRRAGQAPALPAPPRTGTLTARIAEVLADGPATATEIAARLGVTSQAVTVRLREDTQGRFVRTGEQRRPPGAVAGRPSKEWRLR